MDPPNLCDVRKSHVFPILRLVKEEEEEEEVSRFGSDSSNLESLLAGVLAF